ncbi:hypothetical protein OG905_27195 [Streptomyces sp. NBC_00322]|uniref:hypothetical protein n=1 Tax=Streptomyces sp. NBC_00322 TaxID=2975712 RepID=UPI002E29BC2F|nr:hypothetical protein [Streptomyces sp. NBC_00322]
MREGRVELFGHLYRRHYAAVQAYASQCMPVQLRAHDVTSQVFGHLLQRMVSGAGFVGQRYPGCLRLQLLGNVRTTAIASWHQEREALSPDFRAWVAAGGRWPWGEDGQLALAFQRLPATAQRLLWHSVVDGDDPVLTARITGLAPDAVPDRCDQARSALRRARTDLYLERLGRQDCKEVIKRLALRPEASPTEEVTEHLGVCPACLSVYKDVSRLDGQLEAQLPVRLLGWWTGQDYLRAKAAIPVPLDDPPFLTRLTERAPVEAPAQRPRMRRDPAAAPRHRRGMETASTQVLRRSRAAVAVSGFLAGVAMTMVTLSSCDDQNGDKVHPPAASGTSPAPGGRPAPHTPTPSASAAENLVRADAYTSQRETTAGSGPGTRVLGSSSFLRYDRVDFSGEGDTLAHARLAGPAGGGAWIELRLDTLTRSPLARITPTTDGSVDDISVPIMPVDGPHRVYVVAHCPMTAEQCVELHAFGTAPSLRAAPQ